MLCPASLVAFAEQNCIEFLAFIDLPCSGVQLANLNHGIAAALKLLGGPVQVGGNSKPKTALDHAKFKPSDVVWRINELAQKLPEHRMVLQGAPVVYLYDGLEDFINGFGAAKLLRIQASGGF
jgi:hypothetical protein